MRRILTTSIVAASMMIATPALADTTVTIEHDPGHRIVERDGANDGSIRTDIVGSFLWVLYEGGETVSVDVSDDTITGAHISDDGVVTLHRETPESQPVNEPQPEPEKIDLVTRYPEFPVF